MRRLFSFLLCVFLTVGLLAGCSEEKAPYTPTGDALDSTNAATKPTDQGTATQELSLVYDPGEPLNPFQCVDNTNRVLFSLVYQGLFTVDRNYNVYPILCDTYNVSADMKTYTFHLCDALFSDGTKVTAADVAASLNAAKESPWYGGRLQHAHSIAGYGDAVVIELSTPMENLPILLDIPIVKASEVAARQPLGSGPYRIDISQQGAYLRRQAAWWCSAQLPVAQDMIPLVAGESPSQIRDAFEFRGVSLVCSDPGSEQYADYRSDYELWDCENGKFLYLVIHDKSVVFADPALRQALTYAIDREVLAERVYHGFARAASLPASPQSPWYNTSLAAKYAYAPQKFADAVTAAALESNAVTLLLNGDDVIRMRTGQAIAEMLTAGGLKVTIKKSTSEKLAQDLAAGGYDLYLGQTKLSQNMDLTAFFGTNTGLNYGGLADPALYATALEALANSGNYYNLHETVMEDGQLCPILFQNYAIYTQRGAFSNLPAARDAIFGYTLGRTLEDAWINQD